VTTSSSALLLATCVCGEPLFRHRLPDGRQISCAAVRRLDEALQANNQPARHSIGPLHQVARPREPLGERVIGGR